MGEVAPGEVTQVAAATSSQNPEVGLAAVAALRGLVEVLEALQVENARAKGWSWQQIAARLGVTKQAVHHKYAGRRSGFRSCSATSRPAGSWTWPGRKPTASATATWAPSIWCWVPGPRPSDAELLGSLGIDLAAIRRTTEQAYMRARSGGGARPRPSRLVALPVGLAARSSTDYSTSCSTFQSIT